MLGWRGWEWVYHSFWSFFVSNRKYKREMRMKNQCHTRQMMAWKTRTLPNYFPMSMGEKLLTLLPLKKGFGSEVDNFAPLQRALNPRPILFIFLNAHKAHGLWNCTQKIFFFFFFLQPPHKGTLLYVKIVDKLFNRSHK